MACRKDTNGQFIALNISYSDKQIILANIYAPNTDNPGFFINAFSHIDSFGKMDNIIVCGDFNLVLDSSVDYENYKDSNHNINSRKLLIKTIIERELMDPFRHLHGETRKYTWKRFSSLQRGRLDFFLTTKSLIPLLRNCDIDISYRSDHSIIVLELQFSNKKTWERILEI